MVEDAAHQVILSFFPLNMYFQIVLLPPSVIMSPFLTFTFCRNALVSSQSVVYCTSCFPSSVSIHCLCSVKGKSTVNLGRPNKEQWTQFATGRGY